MTLASLEVWRYHARKAEACAAACINLREKLMGPQASLPFTQTLEGDIFQTSQQASQHARIARTIRDGFEIITHRGVVRA